MRKPTPASKMTCGAGGGNGRLEKAGLKPKTKTRSKRPAKPVPPME